MNKVTLIENAIDPQSWQTFECNNVCEFLVERFGTWPKNARIYHNYVAESANVTPYDEAGIKRLNKLTGDFFVVIYPEGLLVVLVIVAIALSAAAIIVGYLLRPSLPTNQQSQSPNNSLTNRENRERLGQRIPDIFGELWATPDLIALPYRIFIGNKEVEYMYMCVGRGRYDVAEVRDDVTPLEQIDGAGCEIYAPFTSPNSGDQPQLRIGDPINTPIQNVKGYSSVNGQTLRAPNANKLKGSNNIRFTDDGTIQGSGDIDFTDYFSPGSVTNPKYVVVGNSNYNGTYLILDVTQNEIVLSNPASVNGNWSGISGATSYGSPTLIQSGDNWEGPYTIVDNTITEIWCNFVAMQGLYEMDSDGNQHAMAATIQIEITSIDNSYNPQGNPVYYQATLRGSNNLKTQCGVTLKAVLPIAGACQIRARRLSNTDLRDGWQVSDTVQWRDLYAVSPVSQDDFGNVTTVQTVTWPTPSALSVKQRKLNLLVSRTLQQASSPTEAMVLEDVEQYTPSNFNSPSNIAADWDIDGNSATQNLNAAPSILLSNKTLYNANADAVQGTFRVSTGSAFEDDDFIGFVFGFQDQQHLYIFDWKAVTQSGAFAGMTVRCIHADSALVQADLWPNTQGGVNASRETILYNNSVPWAKDTTYTFYLTLREGGFTITVKQGTTILDIISINDTTYTSGRFGLYNFSQDRVTYTGFLQTPDETAYVGTKNAADIICNMALDPFIGRRLESEIDRSGIYAILGPGGEVETYFGTSLCTEFCFTFDDAKQSFEEMLSQLCQAVFCTAFRRGNILSVSFEKQTENSIVLFNHRNKIPGSETRTVNFGSASENDGIDLDYIEPNAPNAQNVDSLYTLHFPDDESAVAPRKITAYGVRNRVQAWILGHRLYNKLRYQNTAVQFDATAEAGLCVINDRILVADNTRPDVQDGEIMAQNGLEITLSQPVTFVEGLSYTIFIQHYDATVEALTITEGSAPNKVVLSQAPAIPLVLDPTMYARTTYIIIDDSPQPSAAYLLSEKEAKDGGQFGLKGTNYDERFYEHDSDYTNNIVDVIAPGTGSGSGYNKQAVTNVYVDGKAMPWVSPDNASYTYGRNDGKAPVAVGIQTPSGGTVAIAANAPGQPISLWFWSFQTNTVRRSDEGSAVDVLGESDHITGDTSDSNGYFPTHYTTDKTLGRCGLVGCWAKKDTPTAGKYQVIQPFVIGYGGNFTVPAGGVDTLLLGINDNKFSDNQGGFQVLVTQANDTAGDAAGQDPTPDDNTTNPNDTIWDFTVNGA